MANEIRGDDLLLGVLDDALVLALGSGLDDGLYFIVGSLFLKADDEVDDRDIDGGNAEGETAVDQRSLRVRGREIR